MYVRNVRFKEDPVSLVDDRVKTQIKNQARKKKQNFGQRSFFSYFFLREPRIMSRSNVFDVMVK